MIVVIRLLELGLKVPDIRVIIHVDRSRNLLKYRQESGRAKRNELLSEAIIVKVSSWQSDAEDEDSAEDVLVKRLMREETGEENKCCRIVLDEYMDEVQDWEMCADDEAKCDICRGSTERVEDEEEHESLAEVREKERTPVGEEEVRQVEQGSAVRVKG